MGKLFGLPTFFSGALFVVFGINMMSHAETMPANMVVVSTSAEPMQSGKFEPTWESLEQYQVPEWFRNAKFGISGVLGAAMSARAWRLVCAIDVHARRKT